MWLGVWTSSEKLNSGSPKLGCLNVHPCFTMAFVWIQLSWTLLKFLAFKLRLYLGMVFSYRYLDIIEIYQLGVPGAKEGWNQWGQLPAEISGFFFSNKGLENLTNILPTVNSKKDDNQRSWNRDTFLLEVAPSEVKFYLRHGGATCKQEV